MPELPEVESLRCSLLPFLIGSRVTRVTLNRPDIVGARGSRKLCTRLPPIAPESLLQGCTITGLHRLGKHIAIRANHDGVLSHPDDLNSDRFLVVQLGMTGSLAIVHHRTQLGEPIQPSQSTQLTQHALHAQHALHPEPLALHTHVRWWLTTSLNTSIELRFIDPRRFGSLHCCANQAQLDTHWSKLGPDALDLQLNLNFNLDLPQSLVTPTTTSTSPTTSPTTHENRTRVRASLAQSKRDVKSVLLDQHVVAGVGNIYADEALFAARINPSRKASSLTDTEAYRLLDAIPTTLIAAISLGGSTIRDYVNATGSKGQAQALHAVYGRAGLACVACSSTLAGGKLAQRATVWCPACQR